MNFFILAFPEVHKLNLRPCGTHFTHTTLLRPLPQKNEDPLLKVSICGSVLKWSLYTPLISHICISSDHQEYELIQGGL